jgi:excisionase family DNA binding protein
MLTEHPDITGRRSADIVEPLAVSPRDACRLLAIGNTRLYELLERGELVSYREGRARRITVASIRGRIAELSGAGVQPPAQPTGRPRKRSTTR